MGIVGILWLIGIVLKAFALIATSWLWVLLWPIPVILVLWLILTLFGVSLLTLGLWGR